MRVLGIDPGTRRTGYGVVETQGDRLVMLGCGVVAPKARLTRAEALHFIHRQLYHLIRQYQPREIAIEEPFVARNVRSAMAIGEAQAVAMVAAAAHGISVHQYTPAHVKRVVADYGASTKEQVQAMVRLLLGLSEPPQPLDAADALAVAICHIQERRLGMLLPS